MVTGGNGMASVDVQYHVETAKRSGYVNAMIQALCLEGEIVQDKIPTRYLVDFRQSVQVKFHFYFDLTFFDN